MYLKPTYSFFISLFFVFSLVVSAQSDAKKAVEEAIEVPRRKIIRLGVDPSRFALSFLQPATRGGLEFSLDTEVLKRFYAAGELGSTFVDVNNEMYHYKANGVYGRIGFDYNLLNPVDANDHDAFFVGMRFAGSWYSQEADDIQYSNASGSWTTAVPKENLNAYWSEITVGVKVEAFKNFWVGWTARGKLRFRQPDSQMEPYLIPGYGKLSKTTNFNGDMNIYLMYSFSL